MVRCRGDVAPCRRRARKAAEAAEVEPAAKVAKVRFTSGLCSNFAKLQVTIPTATITLCDGTIFPYNPTRSAATEVQPVAAAAVGAETLIDTLRREAIERGPFCNILEAETQLWSDEDGRLGRAGGDRGVLAHCDSLRGRVALFEL